jgi:hypothetical protein
MIYHPTDPIWTEGGGDPKIGTDAVELYRAVQRHRNGGCEACGTLFAVFTVGSPQGRFADKFLNTPYTLWLEEVAYDHGAGDRLPREYETAKSDAAQAVIDHQLRRNGRDLRSRRVAMTEAARVALLSYYREKVELIGKVSDLLELDDSLDTYRRSFIRRHTKAIERLISSLKTVVVDVAPTVLEIRRTIDEFDYCSIDPASVVADVDRIVKRIKQLPWPIGRELAVALDRNFSEILDAMGDAPKEAWMDEPGCRALRVALGEVYDILERYLDY